MIRLLISAMLLLASLVNAAQLCTNGENQQPNHKYTHIITGTVIDEASGLMWSRCALGQTMENDNCTDSATTMTLQSALLSAEASQLANFDDWRLPNIKELTTLWDYNCQYPAVNEFAFGGVSSKFFWSSTPHADNPEKFWGTYLTYIRSRTMTSSGDGAVMLVRRLK